MTVYGHFNEMADGSGLLLCLRVHEDVVNFGKKGLIVVDKRPSSFESRSEAQIYCDMNGYILDNNKWQEFYQEFCKETDRVNQLLAGSLEEADPW